MGSIFQSFQKSPLGAFVKSPLGARNAAGELVMALNFRYSGDPTKDIFDVGWLSNDFEKIGENEGFDSNDLLVDVNKILGHKKNLYVTGPFVKNIANTRTYNNIAKLNTSDGIWETLAGTDLDSEGEDMCIYLGDLIIAGDIDFANGLSATEFVAGWDGEKYFALGDITSDMAVVNEVRSCTVFAGDLWLGGAFFSNAVPFVSFFIAKFDGANWATTQTAGGDKGVIPDVMLQHKTSLITGGREEIAEWTGTAWIELSTTVRNGVGDGTILGMTIFEDDLILCGSFSEINSTSFNDVVRWDGTNFSAMGLGLGTGTSESANDVHVTNGKLYAIGNFTENGDGDTVKGLAVWNPETEVWDQAGINTGLTTVRGNSLSTFTGKLDGKLPT